jgi:hypothetical protein
MYRKAGIMGRLNASSTILRCVLSDQLIFNDCVVSIARRGAVGRSSRNPIAPSSSALAPTAQDPAYSIRSKKGIQLVIINYQGVAPFVTASSTVLAGLLWQDVAS